MEDTADEQQGDCCGAWHGRGMGWCLHQEAANKQRAPNDLFPEIGTAIWRVLPELGGNNNNNTHTHTHLHTHTQLSTHISKVDDATDKVEET